MVIDDGNGLETVQQARELLESIINKGMTFTALLACNDWMAVGALNAAKAMGIAVPDKLSIIGFDNTIISQITEPRLTTVDQSMTRLGQLAAERICELITESDQSNKKIVIETKLIQRESCAKI